MLLERGSSKVTNDFPKNRKKILIVDDDETILYILRRFFIGEGFEVLVAKDGLEAMERLKAENLSLVLTDIKMPSFSGIDLIRFIRQNMKGIPIVAMTAYPYLYPEKRNGNEVDAYFRKPFDINEMLSSIEKILGG
ncbi:MAG: two component transcriptional regulator, winged helix family [Deltaproteobacteria bacterium]|nr:two component transcriptional regulator, winged helix family [Deltaproteobacteria bacterium]